MSRGKIRNGRLCFSLSLALALTRVYMHFVYFVEVTWLFSEKLTCVCQSRGSHESTGSCVCTRARATACIMYMRKMALFLCFSLFSPYLLEVYFPPFFQIVCTLHHRGYARELLPYYTLKCITFVLHTRVLGYVCRRLLLYCE